MSPQTQETVDNLTGWLDAPITKRLMKVIWTLCCIVGASIAGYLGNAYTSLHENDVNIYSRVNVIEDAISKIQETQTSRAIDNERYQSEVLSTLKDLSSKVDALRLNQASMNTTLKNIAPNTPPLVGLGYHEQ